MKLKTIVVILALFETLNVGCFQKNGLEKGATKTKVSQEAQEVLENEQDVDIVESVKVGAERLQAYLPFFEDEKIALVVNQTSSVGKVHLADTLQALGVQIEKIFAPEHGFRGTADAGEKVKDGKDVRTGIPLVSLYGKKKKPSASDLAGIDLIVFDIQDVGARFYTYISTMHYVMEACAENDLPFLVLDRPNPNGHYVDGPILEDSHQSFVGMHSIPVVHGMTVGELAKMINNEAWLKGGAKCELTVIPCENYDHQTFYELPIKPSPNLPNMHAIYLYPSLCFFEGTTVSVGRGTNKQFQIYGAPNFSEGDFTFTPKPMDGAKYPKHKGKLCQGYDLSNTSIKELKGNTQLNLNYLINAYQNCSDKRAFFLENLFFDKLAGNSVLRKQVLAGKSALEIQTTWQEELNKFKAKRKQYLLYADFE